MYHIFNIHINDIIWHFSFVLHVRWKRPRVAKSCRDAQRWFTTTSNIGTISCARKGRLVFEVFELWESLKVSCFFRVCQKIIKLWNSNLSVQSCAIPFRFALQILGINPHPPARAYFESTAEAPDQGGSTLWFTVSTLFTKNVKDS